MRVIIRERDRKEYGVRRGLNCYNFFNVSLYTLFKVIYIYICYLNNILEIKKQPSLDGRRKGCLLGRKYTAPSFGSRLEPLARWIEEAVSIKQMSYMYIQ